MAKKQKRSKRQETRIAKELGGRVVPASGALWGAKGDVRTKCTLTEWLEGKVQFLCEAKYTDKIAYPLRWNTWVKIALEAVKDGLRIPLMCIDLCAEFQSNLSPHRYCVMWFKDLRALCPDWRNYVSPLEVDTLYVDSKTVRISTSCANVTLATLSLRLDVMNDPGTLAIIRWSTFLEMKRGWDGEA